MRPTAWWVACSNPVYLYKMANIFCVSILVYLAVDTAEELVWPGVCGDILAPDDWTTKKKKCFLSKSAFFRPVIVSADNTGEPPPKSKQNLN